MYTYLDKFKYTFRVSSDFDLDFSFSSSTNDHNQVDGGMLRVSGLIFEKTGNYKLYLIAQDLNDGTLKQMQSFDLYCRYVRREFRKLVEGDRKKLLDAMYLLYTVPTEKGKNKCTKLNILV